MTPEDKIQNAEELVRAIARALVTVPDAVEVEAVEDEDDDEIMLLELRVDPQDLGRVIGKQGRTARSLRTLLNAVGMKHHQRYTLDIVEDDDEEDDDAYEDVANPVGE
jgi:predicted RNA-binding protein YlqC (UPF0109 family)